MPVILHVHHHHDLNKVANVKTVCCRVKTNIKSDCLFAKQLFNFCFMGSLFNKAAFH